MAQLFAPDHKPAIRWPVEIRHESFDNQEVILFTCPLGLAEKPLGLMSIVAPILARFDGTASVQEIANQFSAQGATLELVLELAKLLDDHLFLDTPKFRAVLDKDKGEFAQRDSRAASLAGLGYPSKPEQLADQIEKYLAEVKSPLVREPGQLLTLITPHIDYPRGSQTYANGYRYLRGESPDLVVLIGTSHQYSEDLFHLTLKDFETPFGALNNAREFTGELAKLYGRERSFRDEYLHKREHSLELQAPFLKYFLPEVKIIPVLVGGFHGYLQGEVMPQGREEYETFAQAFLELLVRYRKGGSKILFVAGVDMAHVGANFGDPFELTPQLMEQIAKKDKRYLEYVQQGRKDQLWDHIAADMDRRRICGFSTLYLVLDLLERMQISFSSQLMEYRQAVDSKRECGVTFASLGIWEQS